MCWKLAVETCKWYTTKSGQETILYICCGNVERPTCMNHSSISSSNSSTSLPPKPIPPPQVAVYRAGSTFRSRSLATMGLRVAEGHVIGQVGDTSACQAFHCILKLIVAPSKAHNTVWMCSSICTISPAAHCQHLKSVTMLLKESIPASGRISLFKPRLTERSLDK